MEKRKTLMNSTFQATEENNTEVLKRISLIRETIKPVKQPKAIVHRIHSGWTYWGFAIGMVKLGQCRSLH